MLDIQRLNYFGQLLAVSTSPTKLITGTAAIESVVGTTGADALDGKGGADTLAGGLGDDTYIVQYRDEKIIEAAAQGIDTVKTTTNFVLPDNVENLYVTGFSGYAGTFGTGNSLANIITGDANPQFIDGAKSNDVLTGGGGSDTFIFRPQSGYDVISDFSPAVIGSGGDVVRLQGYDLHSFAEVTAAMTQVGADVSLQLSASDAVLFRNTSVSGFTAQNFQLSLDRSNFRMTFADEFSGTTLDLSNASNPGGKWVPEFGFGGYGSKASHYIGAYTGEVEIYVDPAYAGSGSTALGLNPFNLGDGVLEINSGVVPDVMKPSLYNISYYSGMLSSRASFAQTYGYFEMRAELPSQVGAWPAFWLLPASGKNATEIDVLEAYGSDVNGIRTTVHDTLLPNGKVGTSTYIADSTTAFHTYGMLWTASTLTWYIDDIQVYQVATPADLNSPMYMIINLPIGAVAGTPDPGNMPSGYMIDYVHAYQIVQGVNLVGTAGADTLVGSNGDDTLNGGLGSDVLIGGAGNDTYFVDNGQDVVREYVNDGFDTVYVAAPSWTATNASYIDKIVLTGTSNANLTGNALAMELNGNAGINTLSDGGGADLLKGGLGNDKYLVTNASTHVVEAAGEGLDTVKTTLNSYTLDENVENLTFTGTGSFYGVGNNINGTITGGADSDTLVSGTGIERLVGGGGHDTFYVNNANDIVVANAGGDSVVYTSVNFMAPGNVSTLIYNGTGNFTGYAAAAGTIIIGGTGNDSLIGRAGNDVLDGGAGNNILTGGGGIDTFRFAAPGAGMSRITDFVSGADKIQLSASGFGFGSSTDFTFVSGANPTTVDNHESVLYNTSSGNLYFDPTGGDNHDLVQIAVLTGHPALSALDFIIS